jgi:hypothetical protein
MKYMVLSTAGFPMSRRSSRVIMVGQMAGSSALTEGMPA